MIIKQYAKEDEIIHGDVESVDCTIKTDDAKLFHILSNLYSRPLNAVVRELSTNCLDGHRVVGKEKVPFEIRISNSVLDDEFNISFRDFGPGMSKSTIVKVFSTFGESTKINSNLETGCLGLGSKSPFAVTSTFMVVSYIDNIKYIYNMSKDATGRPKITLFNESYTEEPNGMEITVPLDHKSYDSDRLVDAIYQELHFFKTKPIILINGQPKYFPVDKKNYKKTSFMCYKIDDYSSNNINVVTDIAVQGEIGYHLDIDKLLKACSTNNTLGLFETNSLAELNIVTKEILEKIHNEYNFHMYFDNGTISFAPSREELIYDQFTVKNILKRVLNNAKSMINRYHQYMENLNLPELVGLTIQRLNFNIPVRKEAVKRFYGIVTNEVRFRAIYISIQSYAGKTYNVEEQEELQLHKASYMRISENGNIRVRLNSYGNFASTYSSDSLDDEKTWPIQFKETLELLSIRSSTSYGTPVVTLASLKSNKIKTNESNMVLRDYNKSGIVFVDPMLTKFTSYKLKIDNYIRFADSGLDRIYLYRGTHSQRRIDAMHRFFGRYGIDYSKDFKVIDVQTIIDFNNELIAKQKLLDNGKPTDTSGKLLPKEFREKDDIPFYRLTKVTNFNQIYNSTKKSPFSTYNQDVFKFNPDDKDSIKEAKNLLYIPLDNKKKSTGYIEDQLSGILSYSLFKKSSGESILNGTSIYDILDQLCYVKYNKHWKVDTYINGCKYNLKHPFADKTIVIMNEAKAKKAGIRSLKEYFERFILKLMDFSKYKNTVLISVDRDSISVDYARWHNFAQMFGLIKNGQPINLTRLHSNGIAAAEENTERYKAAEEMIQTRFTNIQSKFYQCDFTTNLFETLENLNFATPDKKMILLPSYLRPTQILKCIELYNPNTDMFRPTFDHLDNKQKHIFDEFVKLAKYIQDGTMCSWTIDKHSPSKMRTFMQKVDQFLLKINSTIVNFEVETCKTFVDEEITVEKEADATIVA